MNQTEINKLISQGYCRTSRQGYISRIDREDWEKFMLDQGYKLPNRQLADQYRRIYSRDILIINRKDRLRFPTSTHNSTGFLPKT